MGAPVKVIHRQAHEFYRNPDQWELLHKEFFPYLMDKFGKKLNIWSAACSTGDEPYSLVMALSRFLPLSQIHIVATDIDKQVIAQAKTGLYSGSQDTAKIRVCLPMEDIESILTEY